MINTSEENKKLLSKSNFMEDERKEKDMLFPVLDSSKEENLSQKSIKSY